MTYLIASVILFYFFINGLYAYAIFKKGLGDLIVLGGVALFILDLIGLDMFYRVLGI